jgi:hypothetical protein
MKFAVGDRVVMIRHADWKSDAVGTISGGPRERTNAQGTNYLDYWIEFDEPQRDLTDEINGDLDRTYQASTVAEEFLRLIDIEPNGTNRC